MEIIAREGEITAIKKFVETSIETLTKYSFQIIAAIIILVVGFIIARWISSLVLRLCEKKKLEVTLSRFLASVVKIIIIVMVVILALGKFGLSIAPFIAAIGALAFGATYALQGPLSNYASGLTIIMGRPFIVGDTISVKEVNGVVDEIKLACTNLITEDGVKVTIPNKHIVGEILWSSKKQRIIEASVGISYGDDPEKAISIIRETLKSCPDVDDEPAVQIGIDEFGDSSVNIAYRYCVQTGKYFQTKYAINLAVFKALQKANITIPFPQREVNIIKS
ncbi:MAG: mechanosensitive ion channel family protein [Planctomycetota bacterium]|jgi:small conductance mechanosensitive channel